MSLISSGGRAFDAPVLKVFPKTFHSHPTSNRLDDGFRPEAEALLPLYCREMIEDVAHWPSGRVRVAWHEPDETRMPVTGAHGFCFYDDRVLVCEIPHRGLTIPGGHIDRGESAADCLIREALEEGCVGLTNLCLLGFIEADHRENSEFTGRYPMRSVQAIYRADVAMVHEFKSRHESTRRQFVEIEELPSIHHEWNAVLQAAMDLALKTVQPKE